MRFQHSTPMPSGISTMLSTSPIGVPQMATIGDQSGLSLTIIPGDTTDTLSINLVQLLIGWGGVTQIGKFEFHSKGDTPIVVFQDNPAGNLVLPCWSIPRFLGNQGFTVLNNSTGGEYSVTANYIITEV